MADDITFSLIGELRKSTASARQQLTRFDLSIAGNEENTGRIVIPTGTIDMPISFPGIDSAQLLVLIPVDNVDENEITLHFNTGSEVKITKALILMGTDIQDLMVSNDSGNEVKLAYWAA